MSPSLPGTLPATVLQPKPPCGQRSPRRHTSFDAISVQIIDVNCVHSFSVPCIWLRLCSAQWNHVLFCTLVTTTPHDYATETLLIFAVSISPLSYQFSSPVPASLFGKLPRQTPTLPVNPLQFSSVSLLFALSTLLCCYQSVMMPRS